MIIIMRKLVFYWLLISICLATCPSYSYSSGSDCLPCSSRCPTCVNNTFCSSCSDGYYLSSGSCFPCLSDCETCTNSTACVSCATPYILSANLSTCSLCLVSYALTCSSLTNVTSCVSTYFPQQSYCASCVLHCSACSNMTTCIKCEQGYMLQYQNSVCSACKNCRECAGALTNCTACWNGQKLTASGSQYTCAQTVCGIQNCDYCAGDGVCGNCKTGYYLKDNGCLLGSSLLCGAGAIGTKPNQCVANCSYNTYSSTSTTPVMCIPKQSLNSSKASQSYFYMFNDYLNILPSAILANGCADQSYVQQPADITLQLSNYYRLNVKFKGYSLSNSGNLTLVLSNSEGSENISYPYSTSCGILYGDITTQQLNSNSVTLSFVDSSSFGLIELLLITYKCPSTCLKCLNPDICLKCAPPLYVFNYQCITDCLTLYRLNVSNSLSCVLSCPDGYFNSVVNNLTYCVGCTLPCLTCSNSTVCFSCTNTNGVSYYYLSTNNSCVATCPNGTFVKNGACVNCMTPCATCTSQSVCLTCLFGYMNGTNCTNMCPDGKYGSSNTHLCESCDASCKTCLMAATTCTSCNLPKILFESSCSDSCRDGYYKDIVDGLPVCKRCITPCNTCTNSTSCLSCSFGYLYNLSCLNTCPVGYYSNVSTFVCTPCSSICSSCSSETYCTECIGGYCLQSGQCINTSCMDTYYPMTISLKCFCTSCSYPCNTCTSQTGCSSCISGYLSNSTCLSSCPSGFYGNDSSQECRVCSLLFPHCKTCSEENCSVCDSGYFSNPLAADNSSVCINTCPETMYNDTVSCRFCVSPCKTCADQTTCVTCVDGYVWKDGVCLSECASGEYVATNNNGIKVCVACKPPCLTCTAETQCLSCLRVADNTLQTYYNGSHCTLACPSMYYPEIITLRCEKCLAPCLTCSSQSACLTCSVGFLNNDTSKCELCPSATYPNTATKQCSPCSPDCDMCSSFLLCSHCTNSTFLFNNSCISESSCKAKLNYYPVNSVCSRCLSPCDQCTSESVCVTCLTGYMFYNNTCIVTCPTGFYGSTVSGCQACSVECASCVGNSTTCLNCTVGYLYYQRTCVVKCPKQTYTAGGNCVSCKYPCLECLSDSNCTSCQNGALDQKTMTCLSSCPVHYYAVAATGGLTCAQCDTGCSECTGTSTNCTQCPANKYLFGSGCLSTCPDTYFGDNQVNTCFSCLAPCLYCTDQVTCTKCADEYVYMPSVNQCLMVCPNGFFQILNPSTGHNDSKYICQSCKSQCLTCNTTTSCLLCKTGYQYGGNCVVNCPSKTFSKDGSCFSCILPCDECVSATTCTSCPANQGYLLVGNSSCIISSVCPVGYYLEQGTTNCNAMCPTNYYRETNTRTCVLSCPNNYFKSADWMCVKSCPSGYYGNETYYCVACGGDSCKNVLNFNVTSDIIGDSLYLYIGFTVPARFNREMLIQDISLSRAIPFKIESKTNTTIVLNLLPTESFEVSYVEVSFPNSFSLFSSSQPLQNPTEGLILPGFNLYPATLPDLSLFSSLLSLFSGVLFMVRGYFALDFLQVAFLYGLINIHYPPQLQSFLNGFKMSSFYFKIAEVEAPAKYKFRIATRNMGLLENTLHVFVIAAVVIVVGGLAWLVSYIRNRARLNKVDTEREGKEQGQVRAEQSAADKHLSTVLSAFEMEVPLRFLYIFYSYLSLFTVCELFNFGDPAPSSNLFSRYLSPPVGIVLVLLPCVLLYRCESHRLVAILLLRKLILSICVVCAVQSPIYVAGFMVMVNMCTLVILPAQKPVEWNVELIVYNVGEALQILIVCLIVGMGFAGEGRATEGKMAVGTLIVGLVVVTVLLYIFVTVAALVLYVLKLRGRDYVAEWMKRQQEESNKQVSENDIISDVKLKKELDEVSNAAGKSEEQNEVNQAVTGEVSKQQLFDRKRAETAFEVYKGDSSESDQSQQPPGVLVRVVNKFDDFDKVM